MVEELQDQLRRYADALEEHLDPAAWTTAVLMSKRERPRRRVLTAVAAIVLIGAVGLGIVVATGDEDSATTVLTDDEDATTTSIDPPTTSTTMSGAEATTTTTITTGTTMTTGGPTTSTSSTVPTTSTSVTAAPTARISGSVAWPGRDSRGVVRVGACPSNDTSLSCPSMRSTAVRRDGTYELSLPPLEEGAIWRVTAYVTVQQFDCVFNCAWANAPRNVVRGQVHDVAPNVDHTLDLSVAARVVDVFVRDRDGNPFEGGGVQVTDTRCNDGTCPEDKIQSFYIASSSDGAARLVVNPDLSYAFHGQAVNTGWPHDPEPWTNGDDEFWFSPDETMTGAALDEGHVFYINGGPADSG